MYITHRFTEARLFFPASNSSCGSLSSMETSKLIWNAGWSFICLKSAVLESPLQIRLTEAKGRDSGGAGHPGHIAHDMRSNHSYN